MANPQFVQVSLKLPRSMKKNLDAHIREISKPKHKLLANGQKPSLQGLLVFLIEQGFQRIEEQSGKDPRELGTFEAPGDLLENTAK